MSETTGQAGKTQRSQQETLFEVRNLKKYYGGDGFLADAPVKAVDDISFDIKRGETFGLVGESGSGKSTLGRTLIQLETATAGTISFDETDVTKLSGSALKEWRRNAQMVFQDPESSLNDRMTVGEIIQEPLNAHNWRTKKERRQRVVNLLSEVGLQQEHYFRYPHQFSGGQRQRVGIARALALEPEFVVLDEPVSALDVSVQAKIITLLEDLQTEFGLTYLFIAHDLSVIRHICDRVAVMYLGKIMELGPTEELYNNPKNPYTKSLLSAIPRPDPNASQTRITLPGTPPSPRDPPKGCQFATRCPAKIRPSEYDQLDDDVWDSIERFREVVRERSRVNLGTSDRLKRRLGMFSKYDDIEAAYQDLFSSQDTPEQVKEEIQAAVNRVKNGHPRAARRQLREEFGSVCDGEKPEHHTVSDTGRQSYCHRHTTDYDDVETVLAQRIDEQ